MKKVQIFILLFFTISTFKVEAISPTQPILPSDNIQDPGALSTPWGGCGPTDANCYIQLTSFQNETVEGLDYSTSTGVLSLTSGYTIPTFASTTAWNSALGALSGSALLQNGNSFGTTLTIGTNDNQALNFETNGVTRLTIDTTGNIIATGTISASSFYGDGSNLTGIFSTSTTRNIFSASGPLSYSTTTGNFLITQASSTTNGYLSSTDFSIFASKENAIAASSTSTYLRGDKTFRTLDTSVVPENGNLYFTNTRVNSILSATTSLPNITNLSGLAVVGTITSGVWNGSLVGDAYLTKSGDWTGVFDGQEGSFYLNRANQTGTQLALTISDFASSTRNLLSSSALGLTYSTSTGVLSLTSDYTIPLTASTTEWASKVSSQWVTNGSNVYYNTGNVGVGTTNPLGRLSVGAGSLTDANLQIQISTAGANTEANYAVNKNGGYGFLLGFKNGTGAFGSIGPVGYMRQVSADPFGITLDTYSTSAMTTLWATNGDVGIAGPITSTTMTGATLIAKATGNVSIGAGSSPSARLHLLSSTEQFRSGFDASNYWNTTTNSTGVTTFNGAGSSASFVFSKNVGIGTTSPSTILSIGSGQISVATGTAALPSYTFGPSLTTGIYSGAANNIDFTTNGTNKWNISAAGSFSGSGAITGGVLYAGSAGSAAAPTIAWSSATDTGFFRVGTTGAAQLGITTSGTERMRFDATGNIGIGTTTPGSALTLGSGRVEIPIGSAASPSLVFSGATTAGLYGNGSGGFGISTGGSERILISASGNIFMNGGAAIRGPDGTSASPGYSFGVTAPSTGMFRPNTGSAHQIGFSTNGIERVRMDSIGNVGIGVTTPLTKLQVNSFDSSESPLYSFASTTFLVTQTNNGGNTPSAPEAALVLGRNGFATQSYSNIADFKLSRYLASGFNSNTQLDIGLTAGSGDLNTTSILSLRSNGNVGVGTTSPADRLQVFGDTRLGTTGSNGCIKNFAGTGITGTCSSDERLKTNIVNLSDGYLDKMANLKVISYQWNEEANVLNKVDKTVTNYGLLAQNVESIFPELVTTDANGYKQVDYSRIPLYLLKSVQELTKKVVGFADEFRTKKLCVGDTCINEDQLKMLLQNQNIQPTQPAPTPTPVVTPEPTPTPEVVVESISEIETSPDPVIEPTPVPVVEVSTE